MLMKVVLQPRESAIFIQCSSIVMFLTSIRHLGVLRVSCPRRVPNPAASNSASNLKSIQKFLALYGRISNSRNLYARGY